MKCEIYSYRFGQEILQHPNFAHAWKEISEILRRAPLFVFPNKSPKNSSLDVVQQLMNAYFDRVFVIENGWEHHPLATAIKGSELTADYRKKFKGEQKGSIVVQSEVQFGNMARFYTDVFKFQAAYSQKTIQVGMSVVPTHSLAKRIDSNVAHFERAARELPSADLSITLPILLVGLSVDKKTKIVDVSRSKFTDIKQITGRGGKAHLRRVVHAYLCGTPMEEVGPDSDPGPAFDVSTDETV